MLPLANEETYENYSRYLWVRTLDADAVRDAMAAFARYQEQGVILNGHFRDKAWLLTDEVRKYHVDFSIDGRKFRAGMGKWCGVDRDTLCSCLKAFFIYSMGDVSLSTLRDMAGKARGLIYSDAAAAMEISPDARVLDFLASLPGMSEERDRVIEAMEENRVFLRWKRAGSRKLSDFRDYLSFDRRLDAFWECADEEQKLEYFPVYFWWKLTVILPLRPTEFLLLPDNSLREENGRWILTVRRTKKKKHAGRQGYRVAEDYELCDYGIPAEMAAEIQKYQEAVLPFRKKENTALLLPSKDSGSWYMTYGQLNYRLKRMLSQEMGENAPAVNLGDTRHLAMINLILSGGSPTICRDLAGHEDIGISSGYYANLSSIVECSVYEHCRLASGEAALDGSMYFPTAIPEQGVRMPDGWCGCKDVSLGDVGECLKNYKEPGRLGECRDCIHFYPDSPGMRLRIRDSRKKDVDLAGEYLMQMIEIVRKGNGCEESIQAAMARLQKAGHGYAGVLCRQFMEER